MAAVAKKDCHQAVAVYQANKAVSASGIIQTNNFDLSQSVLTDQDKLICGQVAILLQTNFGCEDPTQAERLMHVRRAFHDQSTATKSFRLKRADTNKYTLFTLQVYKGITYISSIAKRDEYGRRDGGNWKYVKVAIRIDEVATLVMEKRLRPAGSKEKRAKMMRDLIKENNSGREAVGLEGVGELVLRTTKAGVDEFSVFSKRFNTSNAWDYFYTPAFKYQSQDIKREILNDCVSQVLTGLIEFHKTAIHGDLHFGNILVDCTKVSDERTAFKFALTDYAYGLQIKEEGKQDYFAYRASPEVASRNFFLYDDDISKSNDIYQLGYNLFAILNEYGLMSANYRALIRGFCFSPLFFHITPVGVFSNPSLPDLYPNIDPRDGCRICGDKEMFITFISKLWKNCPVESIPAKRFTAEEAFAFLEEMFPHKEGVSTKDEKK